MSYSNDSAVVEVPVSVRAASVAADKVIESAGLVHRIVAAVRREQLRRETLSQLHALDDRMLADVGLSRGTINQVVDGLLRR